MGATGYCKQYALSNQKLVTNRITWLIMAKEITFETAKLAYQKGFNEPCITHWSYGDGDEFNNAGLYRGGFFDDLGFHRRYRNSELSRWELPYGEFSAPKQSELQEWLRNEYGIVTFVHPYIIPNLKGENIIRFCGRILTKDTVLNCTYCTKFIPDWNIALEKVLVVALNMIP
jgi:hypothetical protein